VTIYPSPCNQPISLECACIRAIDINVFVLSCRRSSFHKKWRSYIILMFFQVEDDHVPTRGHVTRSYQVRNSHWSPAYASWIPVPLGLRLRRLSLSLLSRCDSLTLTTRQYSARINKKYLTSSIWLVLILLHRGQVVFVRQLYASRCLRGQ
jgi:hypothetical protein